MARSVKTLRNTSLTLQMPVEPFTASDEISIPPLTLILDDLEEESLNPVPSPFPDAERVRSTKSLFVSMPRTPLPGSPRDNNRVSKSSPRGFKKTHGNLDDKDDLGVLKAYLEEDEDAFCKGKNDSTKNKPKVKNMMKNKMFQKISSLKTLAH